LVVPGAAAHAAVGTACRPDPWADSPAARSDAEETRGGTRYRPVGPDAVCGPAAASPDRREKCRSPRSGGQQWSRGNRCWYPERFVFIDDTWAKTSM